MDETGPDPAEPDHPVIAAALASSTGTALRALCDGYRPELHLHCYRMLGSLDDADSQLEAALQRATLGRGNARNGTAAPDRPTIGTFRTWLYRVVTRACLDFLGRSPRSPRPRPPQPAPGTGAAPPFAPVDVAWLQPYPDRLLDQVSAATGWPGDAGPPGAAVRMENIQLPSVLALQQLPPRQRAVFIFQDMLDWPAHQCAAVLPATDGAVKSLLHRARQRMPELLPRPRSPATGAPDPAGQEPVVLERYLAAAEHGDRSALGELVHEDVWLTMPPEAVWLYGREQVVGWWAQRCADDLRLLSTGANRQPAVVTYRRAPGALAYQPAQLEVLRIANGRIAEVTSFVPDLVEQFRLPATLR